MSVHTLKKAPKTLKGFSGHKRYIGTYLVDIIELAFFVVITILFWKISIKNAQLNLTCIL